MDRQQPQSGVAEQLESLVRRILAPNPSPMTYWGTNTYIVGETQLAVIDPGPENENHLNAIMAAVGDGQQISHIVVTHAHVDHSLGAARLSQMTGALVYAYGAADRGQSDLMRRLRADGLTSGGEGVDNDFMPDVQLEDGGQIIGDNWTLDVIWTPGHISNHVCLALNDAVFSGDHVMEWATSIVSPPDGDVGAFLESCGKLKHRNDRIYYPGHGLPVLEPAKRCQWLIDHRRQRESQILEVLGDGPQTPMQIVMKIYRDIPDALYPAAERNVFAHLIDLDERGRVTSQGPMSSRATFSLVG